MKPSRRNFIQSLGIGVAGLGTSHQVVAAGVKPPKGIKPAADDQILFVGDNIAVTNTQYGKVRGFILRGINHFLGISYGADTSGKNRFMPPQQPAAWTDIRPALWWGNSAPRLWRNATPTPTPRLSTIGITTTCRKTA